MLNAASEGSLSLSGDDDSAVLHPLSVVALSEPDPAMTAMLSSELVEWFLCAFSSGTSCGVETPSQGGPADLEWVCSCSGRPVCISRNRALPMVLLPIRVNARQG